MYRELKYSAQLSLFRLYKTIVYTNIFVRFFIGFWELELFLFFFLNFITIVSFSCCWLFFFKMYYYHVHILVQTFITFLYILCSTAIYVLLQMFFLIFPHRTVYVALSWYHKTFFLSQLKISWFYIRKELKFSLLMAFRFYSVWTTYYRSFDIDEKINIFTFFCIIGKFALTIYTFSVAVNKWNFNFPVVVKLYRYLLHIFHVVECGCVINEHNA